MLWARTVNRHGARTALLVAGVLLSVSACSGAEPATKTTKSPVCPSSLPAPSFKVSLAQTFLNIYNASSTDGLASRAASELTWRGAHVLSTGNDPNPDDRPEPKAAEIRYGKNGKQVALNLATQVQNAVLYQDDRTNPTVDLILGDGFKFLPVPPPAADRVTLNVYNTTFKSGLSGTVAAELKQRGFKIAKTGNDPGGGFFPDDTAIIRYGEHGEPAARRVQLSVKGARLVKDGRKDETIDLLLGSKFEDVVPAAHATPTIEPTATRPPGC